MAEEQPRFSPTQEVRFALVMYGGSSLCIYMNGVAQEFLNLVRSTAPSGPMSGNPSHVRAATSTETIYRKLGQLLAYGCEPRDKPADDAPVTTRFVVDIISGSSAGGINGVFLARALANDAKLEQLKRLWVEEGDFALLLNDRGSAGDTPKIPVDKPPESLLNSHRMYHKLLEAFVGMGERNQDFESPLVEELDLAVTTTDLRGLAMPIKLYDSVVLEPRYRNVFRLKYRTTAASGRMQNDFADFHAGLAFVARCTSSFPFVFEPMTLKAINAVPNANRTAQVPLSGEGTSWDTVYFPDYARARDEYAARPFSDGGAIDNKPFSYAIDHLAVRRSAVPVVRKLVYVEPDPGQYAAGVDASAPVDPITSALLAGTLPRKETIREDLDRIRAHNLAARRVAEVIETVERALEESPTHNVTGEPTTERTAEATTRWVDQRGKQVRDLGLSHRLYHRTKVQHTAIQLSRLFAEAAGHDPESDRGQAVRLLVQAWIATRYDDPFADAELGESARDTERRFLLDFDLEYRMRRINFVERRADELLCHTNPRSQRLLDLATGVVAPPEEWPAYDNALITAKRELNAAFVDLRRFRAQLSQRVGAEIASLAIAPAQLDAILVPQSAQLVLRAIEAQGAASSTATFGWEIGDYPNPLQQGRFTLTALGPRDDDIERGSLVLGPTDPARTRIMRWPSSGRPGEPALVGLDVASVLVVDLDRPASELAMTVSALAWPPTLHVFGDDGALDTSVSLAPDGAGGGRMTVRAASIRRVVIQSRTADVATQVTPLARAKALLRDVDLAAGIDVLADNMRGSFEEALRAAHAAVGAALQSGDPPDPANTARRALRFFFDQFDAYDGATLALLASYGGEISQVDVLRVSPYDATSLVPAAKAAGKLAGNQLGHYGAFLSAGWRRSDIMWGRLDAAERLITALLPVGHPQREPLLDEVQTIILREELAGEEMTAALEQAVLAGDTGAVPEAVAQVRSAVHTAASPERLRQAIRTGYRLPPGPDPRYTLEVGSRATRIVGDLLKGLTESGPPRAGRAAVTPVAGAGALKWPGRILAGFGQLAWGLVEIAVPGTIRWRVARYYLQLLTFVEVFLIGVGVLLAQRAAVRLGWLSLAITLLVMLARSIMKQLLRSRTRLVSALLGLVGLLIAALAVFGGARAAHNAKGMGCRSNNWVVERAQPFDCPGSDFTPATVQPPR